ncbi:Unknown protein [Striga hermonthica]|uniref:Reverse transcriptase domain-containing protein n=1 Tax=Striga hermonthica TaxID=68872 RepID=A0A9N7N8N0_STRHE|nr:Unknown protein [Striga hermonthica]
MEEGIGAAVIGYEELRHGGFLNKGLKVTHFSERKCYETYLREEELKRMARGEGSSKQATGGPSQPRNWSIVGPSVRNMVREVMHGNDMPRQLNKTLIVLIPKVDCPSSIKEFRPISLLNVVYKLVTKVLTTKMKRLMPLLIGPTQVSFIPGRHITDNIVIAQELIHTMRTVKGKRGYMVIKVDLEKAYDYVRWDYFEETLVIAGFPRLFVKSIMTCVTSATMQLSWNGVLSAEFVPSRGVRQGDPISPYLFVLCMERLALAISCYVNSGQWRPISLGRGKVKIPYLMFADDLLLFDEASHEQVGCVKEVLREFVMRLA